MRYGELVSLNIGPSEWTNKCFETEVRACSCDSMQKLKGCEHLLTGLDNVYGVPIKSGIVQILENLRMMRNVEFDIPIGPRKGDICI
jgi:hypothetical protein